MRIYLIALAALPLLAASAALAQAPAVDDMQALAEKLSDCPPASDAGFNRDGTPRDVQCTRQWVKGSVVQQNINMTFALGSADLTASARSALDRFASGLKRIRYFRPFTVEGHTDRSGSRELNLALSQARAASVVNYLASKGVDRSRLTARGYGFDKPLPGRGATDAANRRVEVLAR